MPRVRFVEQREMLDVFQVNSQPIEINNSTAKMKVVKQREMPLGILTTKGVWAPLT